MAFDVIVIGGGHAGAEAVRVCARGGLTVAMVTFSADSVGRMSCNPAIGGLAKGHLVREIDALGGVMGEATDRAGIQFKLLNRSKGPAVQGPRAQCDRDLYAAAVQDILNAEPNFSLIEGSVARIGVEHNRVTGVILDDGTTLKAGAVIVTTGTFLRALMHSGENQVVGGRFGEPSADGLSDSFRALGLQLGRLKTGTPPRVLASSADYSKMKPQPGDVRPRPFSILTDQIALPQILCYLTYTSEFAHDLIRRNLHRAPMYSGQIQAAGPRYCPSIEDKVVRFADKVQHHVFVEPEGLNHPWLYLNGVSTSLPADIQDAVVRSLPGLEAAEIGRYGYAVEYDFVDPRQLDPTLQVRGIEGLFLAGQINGTSGYEEAAGQGLMAGINAVGLLRGQPPVILRRDEGYLGVMIDDLVTLGTEEPYRMFTSRAEHRLLLGCDSVYERLSPLAADLGLFDDVRMQRVAERASRTARLRESVEGVVMNPDRETIERLEPIGIALNGPGSLARLVQRPNFSLAEFVEAFPDWPVLDELRTLIRLSPEEEVEGVTNRIRYAGYVEKQTREAARLETEEGVRIPADFLYERPGLSREVVEKLNRVRPHSLGQASRIPGVTPAAVSLIRMFLRQQSRVFERAV